MANQDGSPDHSELLQAALLHYEHQVRSLNGRCVQLQGEVVALTNQLAAERSQNQQLRTALSADVPRPD